MASRKQEKLILGVLGSTRGTDLQAVIDEIEAGRLDAEIGLVASDKKDAFILERARKHKIPVLSVDYKKFGTRDKAEKVFVLELNKKKVGLVLLIGFMKILSPYFVREFRGRIWNIHPSLLPKHAGGMNMNVHEEVLRAGEKESGCTLHEVSEEVDAGKIISQQRVPVSENETPETLKEKVQKAEQECIVRALKKVINGQLIIGEQK